MKLINCLVRFSQNVLNLDDKDQALNLFKDIDQGGDLHNHALISKIEIPEQVNLYSLKNLEPKNQ